MDVQKPASSSVVTSHAIAPEDWDTLVALRYEHQTPEAAKGIRTHGVEVSTEFKSAHANLRQELSQTLKRTLMEEPPSLLRAGQDRRERWTGQKVSELESAESKTGNAANAAAAAKSRATAVSSLSLWK